MHTPPTPGEHRRALYDRQGTLWLGTAKRGPDGHWFFVADDLPGVWYKVRADDARLTLREESGMPSPLCRPSRPPTRTEHPMDPPTASLSPQGHAFVQALEAVCRHHGIALSVDGQCALVLSPYRDDLPGIGCAAFIDELPRADAPLDIAGTP